MFRRTGIKTFFRNFRCIRFLITLLQISSRISRYTVQPIPIHQIQYLHRRVVIVLLEHTCVYYALMEILKLNCRK